MIEKSKWLVCLLLIIILFHGMAHAKERVFVVNSYVHGAPSPFWSTVAMLNGKNMAILDTLQIYNDPAFVAASPDGTRLWVPCKNSEYIVVINAVTFEKIRTIDLGDIILQRPFGVAFTPDGNYVYVAYSETGEVGVFNADTTAEILPPISLGAGAMPNYIVFTPDGSKAYVVDYQNSQVFVIRTSDKTVLPTIDFTGVALQDAVVSPDGTRVYVSNMDQDQIEVIRTSDDAALSPIPTAQIRPRGIGISPDGDYLFIGHYLGVDAVVNMLRLSDRTVVSTADIPSNPRFIATRPGGSRIFVTEHNEDECYAYDVSGEDLTFSAVADLNTVPGYYASPVGATIVYLKEDILGTWYGSGTWYRNEETGSWFHMTTPAYIVAAGDIDGDGTDDLIGVWSSGLWVRYSSSGTWERFSSNLPTHIASGDMNGDGRDDVLGTWASGVWYKNSITGTWVLMSSSPATLVAAGDLDGDNIDDLVGVWGSGLWVKYSVTGSWGRLAANLPLDIACGDMNGDGRDDALGTWASGVWYRNSLTGSWTYMSSFAEFVAAGDVDGDGLDDLVGTWSSGLWAKNSSTGSWELIWGLPLPGDFDVGLFRSGWDSMASEHSRPMGVSAIGPGGSGNYKDSSHEGPGMGNSFLVEDNLVPQEMESNERRLPGPGEPGFTCDYQKNPIPCENLKKAKKKKESE